MSGNNKNCIAVVCVDKRMHKSRSNFRIELEKVLGNDNIYTVTYPGADRLVTGDDEHTKQALDALTLIVDNTRKTLAEHGSKHVQKVVVAHATCAGYPASDEEHVVSVKKLAEYFTEALDLEVGFTPYMAYQVNHGDDLHWKIEQVK